MTKLLIVFLMSFSIFVVAQDSSTGEMEVCTTSFTCFAQSTANAACRFTVIMQADGDRSKWSDVGCYDSFATAKSSAKQLAKKGKCTFVDTSY